MTTDIELRLQALARRIEEELARIQGEAIARLGWMARSTGQRTRVDRR